MKVNRLKECRLSNNLYNPLESYFSYTTFIDVILPLSISSTYTYSVPEPLLEKISIGCRVEVQFGKRRQYAAIISKIHKSKPLKYKVKPIITLLDEEPIVEKSQIVFWEWIAEYYMCTLGEVMLAALPAGLKLTSESSLLLNPDYRFDQKEFGSQHHKKIYGKVGLILEALRHQNQLSIGQIKDLLNQKVIYPVIKTLIDNKMVFLKEDLREGYKPKRVKYLLLNYKYKSNQSRKELIEKLEKAPKQLDILLYYLQESKNLQPVLKESITKRIPSSAPAIKSLIQKEILSELIIEEGRMKYEGDKQDTVNLSAIQEETLNTIKKLHIEKDVVLLHGVTSSGKTHIYSKLIDDVLQQKKQVLYLLPEIALTIQIINRLQKYFGKDIGVYHSKFNSNERVEIWKKVLNNEYKIILGARSALFLPFKNLGLVIVDEEHDSSYKQFDPAPRYNARDASIYLAGLHKAKVLLGTATPSLESFYNTVIKKYGYVTLTERYLNIKMPEIKLADLSKKQFNGKSITHFTKILYDHVDLALKQNEQVILFQNRRGYVPILECEECSWSPTCINCDVHLTHHKYNGELVCHYCSFRIKELHQCEACGSNRIKVKGFGTEKIEEEILDLFPQARVARMDLDSTRSKNSYQKIIKDFEERKIDILVGTQMITKGLDFDKVSVVGILNAESLINFPDFRSLERAYQLMAQVSGRAGRKEKRGKVIIQTSNPKNIIYDYVVNNNYMDFFNAEIDHRKNFFYPPFYKLIKISLKHARLDKLNEGSYYLSEGLRKRFKSNVLGPEFPPIERIRNKYIKNIMLKFDHSKRSLKRTKEKVKEEINNFRAKKKYQSITVHIDVDPLS